MRGSPQKSSGSTASRAYDRKKSRSRERERTLTLAGQDIAPCPPPKDLARRAKADGDFRFFCESYFPKLFTLPWSDDHLRVIRKIERAVLHCETFAVAMPRGSGKTTLCQTAVLWAILTGKHPFVFLVASTQEYALSMLGNIKSHLSTSDRLLDDYPEAIYPIRSLEGESRRCSGQRYYGRLTYIGWTADEIVMPTIPGSRCAGAIVRVSGITGNIRGAMFIRPDGSSVRPTLAIIDDPQTDQSARSLSQTQERLAIVNGAIAGLSGPGKRTAMIMPCTVIRAGDLADQVLNREKNPLWQGERTKLVYAFPKNEKLWEEYARIRAESLRNDGDGHEATEFYAQRRAAMDEGALIAWRERYNTDELSAVQHAMNLKFRNEAAFWAEYQNEPLPEKTLEDEGLLTPDQIASKLNGHKRGEVPIGCNHLTMFIDVQGKLLFYCICGWEDDFTGYVLDYGAYPEQKRAYFTLREAQRTLQSVAKGAGLEGAIYAGLESLAIEHLGREWRRDDGAMMRVGLCLVDANWGTSTDVVYQFCRQSQYSAVLMPSHGRFVGAGSKPFSDYVRRPGERVGLNWRIPGVQGKRAVRHVVFDANYWKSFVHSRLSVAMGDRGCLSLFGRDPDSHRLFADHLASEYRVRTEGRGRVVDEWRLRPEVRDNHWLDGLTGCAVAGAIQGVSLLGSCAAAQNRPARVKLSSLRRKKPT
ncbi:MAG: phage terminase large subunit family protein [Planctomycetes bacterium]|nr:phage terminase large subunit family protein [Planctomycetota bacterium]